MCRYNPRVDFAFKKLFGSEENKDLLIDLINSFVSEDDQVVDLELQNPYNPKTFFDDKISILDIKAVDSTGRWFNVEMQIVSNPNFKKRALYYWAKLYSGQLKSAYNYERLCKTICINILNFDCLDQEEYHNIYKIMNTSGGGGFVDDLEIHFVELNKYDEKIMRTVDRWANFLKLAHLYTPENLPVELENVPSIKKAVKELEIMYMTEEEKEVYEAGLKYLRDQDMIIKAALMNAQEEGRKIGIEIGRGIGLEQGIKQGIQQGIEQGIEKGIEKGIQKGIEQGIEKGIEKGIQKGIEQGSEKAKIEIAKNLLSAMDDEQISNNTGLDISIVQGLRQGKI
jgi:predicted transposase/invertase (TIGR01784 family)